MYKDKYDHQFNDLKISLLRCSRFKSIWIVSCLFLLVFVYIVYQVQYKTGIELISFIPIDDSGFELYDESHLNYAEVSKAAKEQRKQGSLLCWIMTTTSYHHTRVKAMNSTWPSRCDSYHFLTNGDRFLDDTVPYHTIFRFLPQSYYKLFWKTRLALLYVFKNISSEFDWYYKADDDTYVVVDVLRKYLQNFDPNLPHFIGFRLKRRAKEHGYNAGGSGYVMSRAAMEIFAEKLYTNKTLCGYHEWEDYAIARCLSSVSIYPTDSRDSFGRQRFLPWRPEQHYFADLTPSFLMDDIEHMGSSIFHPNLVAMHHLSPDEIRLIHGLLYGVAPGIYDLPK
ncbi:unnamed protein product [Auanema sp. JU1783]|nr:unnamed protein product [Auanema sp. JU1783]